MSKKKHVFQFYVNNASKMLYPSNLFLKKYNSPLQVLNLSKREEPRSCIMGRPPEYYDKKDFFDIMNRYCKNINATVSTEEHATGISYISQFLYEENIKNKYGFLGLESDINISRGNRDGSDRIIRPDITLLNGANYFVEVQDGGNLPTKKAKKIIDYCGRIGNAVLCLAFADYINDVRIDDILRKTKQIKRKRIFLFPQEIDPFLGREPMKDIVKEIRLP